MTELTTDTITPGAAPDTHTSDSPALAFCPSLGHVQWRAERLQVCNWGGFDGVHEIKLDPGSTLLTGGSGTGKSTLGDAWLALLQPSGTAFNAASNPAKTRARSEGTRSMISYARGHLDKKATDSGAKEVRKLRGHSGPVWSAIAMTFTSTAGARFTAFRAMHVMPSHRIDSEPTKRFCSVEGPLDLELLARVAPEKFASLALKRVLPGVKIYEGPGDFQDKVAAKLGIGGPNGAEARKALRMLERIQSGQPIGNVNELFTRYVLDEPQTFTDADKAIDEWDKLEDTFDVIDLNSRKFEVLKSIRELHADVEETSSELRTFEGLGLDEATSPWALWKARDEDQILVDAADHNGKRRADAAQAVAEATAAAEEADAAYEEARYAYDQYEGGRLDGLNARLARANVDLSAAISARGKLSEGITELGAVPETETQFKALTATATRIVSSYETDKAALEEALDEAKREQFLLLESKRALVDELASFKSRQGRVDRGMDELRNQAAQLAGMDPADLPYGAELLDVAEDQGQWREAIETMLWPIASCILLDEQQLEHFSQAVDSAGLKGRINFEGVPLYVMTNVDSPEDRVAGKVVNKDSPFQGWLRKRINKPDLNALCVQTPAELKSHDENDVRVTRAGQTRRRQRGSAGRRNRRHIIGFSNAGLVGELNAELAGLEPKLTELDARLRQLRDEEGTLLRRHAAASVLLREPWAPLDVASIETRRDELVRTIEEITDSDTKLKRLRGELAEAKTAAKAANLVEDKAKEEVKAAAAEHSKIVDAQERAYPRLERLEASGVEVSAEQSVFLGRLAREMQREWREIGKRHGDLRKTLDQLAKATRAESSQAVSFLTSVFREYRLLWGENHPSLGETIDSYPDYLAILEEIESFGLHDAAARFRADLVNWSGQQLLRLHGSYGAAKSDIDERMQAINRVLEELAFGPRSEQLKIRVDHRPPVEATDFRRRLSELATQRTRDLTEAEVMPYFKAAQALLGVIRKPDDPRSTAVQGSPTRGLLLDVRRHLNIEADRLQATGDVGGTYDTLGTQSGGESQELLAFILGAALRYQLGDEDHDRPTFAFVVLDEAFVKADPEFAYRSMQAWLKLGFQLLVATPVDKFTALEPLAERFLLTEKDEEEKSYVGRIDRADALAYTADATLRGDHLADGEA
jgi:uncharacterized protein YPO0396